MFTFKIKCPHCGKEMDYHLLKRDWDELECHSCHKPYNVNMKILVVIVMLCIFLILQQIYTALLSSILSPVVAIVGGVVIVFFMSILLIHLLSHKLDMSLFFEASKKEISH